ncbi:MAG: shikimate dehydrogenase [Alphaproteobacteria bacterium]|nr:MAG: shikimate dehydrogenase [Alphaproteobacteria bacterium]
MTDQYAVIGNPIGHTKSPMIHQAFAERTKQDLDYSAILGTIGGFGDDAAAFRKNGGRGLNVTAPFKLDAFRYATRLQEGARLAGAVNCLSFDGDDAIGANFDGVGLTRDIKRNLGFPLRGKRILLLGAGGAVRGALLPFLEQQPAELVLVNRTVAKANALGEQFASYGALVTTGYEQLAQERGQYDIVVNATSASLQGELPPVSASVFGHGCLAYDLLYGTGLTPFLRLAKNAGVQHIADGVGMLVEQAAEAFEWWRGIRPDTSPMIKQLTMPLD